ncbi:hypothetical protein OS173_07450 [Marinicella sp. S6413]|nr:hypothetical protein [Marinicella gelatinilytica]
MCVVKKQYVLLILLFSIAMAFASNEIPKNVAPWVQELLDKPQYQGQINRYGYAVGGELRLKLEQDFVDEIEMPTRHEDAATRLLDYDQFLGGQYQTGHFIIKHVGGLQLFLPFGIFEGVQSGQLFIEGSIKFRHQGMSLDFNDLRIAHAKRSPKAGDMAVLDIIDGEDILFHLDNIHTVWEQGNSVLRYQHVDVRLSQWLADRLNKSDLTGQVVGSVQMINNVSQNELNASLKGLPPQCNSRPVWPSAQSHADVMLIALTGESRAVNGDNTRRIIIPTARLQNIGDADVPWYRVFTGSFPPHNNDQHPYLMWNLYKQKNGRFTQIGASALKHAFYTTNQDCDIDCDNNNILWPGCRDTYGRLSNDNNLYLAPRSEINPFLGTWDSCGSSFDPGCTGGRTNAAASDSQRMNIKVSDFTENQANYFLSAWYLVRDDVNIYNSMGSRQVAYNPSNKYLTNTGPFAQGPAADRWVPDTGFDIAAMTSSFRVLQAGAGHLSVKTKVIDLGGGLYRYHYFVENYDFNPGISALTIPLQAGTSVSQYDFSDVDDQTNNDWALTTPVGSSLQMLAPNGNDISWGYGYAFSVTLSQAPVSSSVTLTGASGYGNFTVPALAPLSDLIFTDNFEN